MRIISPVPQVWQTPEGISGSLPIRYELHATATMWDADETYASNNYAIYNHRLFRSLAGGNMGHVPIAHATGPDWADSGLSSYSNVSVTETVYSAGATYSIGQIRYIDDLYSDPPLLPTRWESLINSNTGHTPYSSPTQWLNAGAINRAAMFDKVVGTQTANDGSIEVGIVCPIGTPVDALALLNLDAYSVTVRFYTIDRSTSDVPLTMVYEETRSLVLPDVLDWREYFFKPISTRADVVFMNIPAYSGGFLSVTLNKTGSTAKCGALIKGVQIGIGKDEWGARASINDYSTKTADAFGNYAITKRAFSKRLSTTVVLPNSVVDSVAQTLNEYRSTPAVWVGDGDFEPMIVDGFYRGFDLLLQSPAGSVCSLEIEGLI